VCSMGRDRGTNLYVWLGFLATHTHYISPKKKWMSLSSGSAAQASRHRLGSCPTASWPSCLACAMYKYNLSQSLSSRRPRPTVAAACDAATVCIPACLCVVNFLLPCSCLGRISVVVDRTSTCFATSTNHCTLTLTYTHTQSLASCTPHTLTHTLTHSLVQHSKRSSKMAEAVRQQLEGQLEELEDLRRRGIFTLEEIRCACAPVLASSLA